MKTTCYHVKIVSEEDVNVDELFETEMRNFERVNNVKTELQRLSSDRQDLRLVLNVSVSSVEWDENPYSEESVKQMLLDDLLDFLEDIRKAPLIHARFERV